MTTVPGWGISPDYTQPMVTGDLYAAVVYRLTDTDGSICQSAPRVLENALKATEDPIQPSGQWLMIPTLRHLMAGTTAQIEVYIGSVDLMRYWVLENDPTIDYIEFSPNGVATYSGGTMPTITAAMVAAGLSVDPTAPAGAEVLYTTGGAFANEPPPQAEFIAIWRNRAVAGFQNRVWVSQEFEVGRGIKWANSLRLDWTDGTGDMLGGCAIDWNYFALFKGDAIGVISGPGPDGMGHGNYIAQTLTTKAGCTTPRSLVNGPDGCYYQDAATGRMMLLGPDLQERECMPGAFDWSTYQVNGALHVENKRQVWFFAAAHVVVLDYKHRPDSAPLGQVYQWPLQGDAYGGAIVGGNPVLMFSTGNTAAQVPAQYYDQSAAGTRTAVLRTIETGDINPFGLQRQFNVSRVQALGEYLAAQTFKVTTYPSFATSGTSAQKDITAAPAQVSTRPPSCMRVQGVRCRFEDVTYAPGTPPVAVYGAGSKLVGFALEVQDHGKLQTLDVGRIM